PAHCRAQGAPERGEELSTADLKSSRRSGWASPAAARLGERVPPGGPDVPGHATSIPASQRATGRAPRRVCRRLPVPGRGGSLGREGGAHCGAKEHLDGGLRPELRSRGLDVTARLAWSNPEPLEVRP